MDNFLTVADRYGLGTAFAFVCVLVLAWFARVSLRNPLEVVSEALSDVNNARRALHEEIIHRDEIIARQRHKILELEDRILVLERKLAGIA